MRILFVSPRFAPDSGGVETVVAHLAAALTTVGHQVQVVTQGHRPLPRYELVDVAGIGVEVHRAPRLWAAPDDVPAPGLYRMVRRLAADADVVHAHSYHTLAAPIAALAARGVPVVLSLHYHGGGHSATRQLLHRVYRPVGRRLVAAAAAVQANSAAEAGLLEQDFAAELAAQPVVIGPGVDTAPAAEPFPSDRPVVLSVCRLEPYKRVDALIAAAARWEGPAELVVVGDGPDRARLESLAVGAPVRFVGRVSDAVLARWWATAAVFASASTDESFGLVVAQAVAVGVPVVASAIPAHSELLAPDRGILVDGYDPQRWATAIGAARSAGRRAPQPLPTWVDAAMSYTQLYEQVGSGQVGQ